MFAQTKRLHISPFTPDSLGAVLRPPLSVLATSISFHDISTFPERSYGFVTLPEADADKLKKKLHGSVLRGEKMRVEEARPENIPTGEINMNNTMNGEKMDPSERRTRRQGKSSRTEHGVMPGIELEDGRKVKRGWTEPEGGVGKGQKNGKDKNPSKQASKQDKKSHKVGSITGKGECLFKTKVPPNTRELAKSPKEQAGKAKKRKRGESNGDIVVHEFSNTEKHAAFLRDKTTGATRKLAKEYVEGTGWVDENGNVVEAAPVKRSRRVPKPQSVAVVPEKVTIESAENDEDATSSSGSSSSEDQEFEDERDFSPGPVDSDINKINGLGISSTVERLSITRSSATPPPLSADEPIPTLKSPAPHPLETLFKRPAKAASQTPKEKPSLEVSTSFAFSDPDAQEVETRLTIPQTPFTQQDIRQRRQRSAAPTPDTAMPGKTFGNVWGGRESSDIEDEEEVGEDEAKDFQNAREAMNKEGEQKKFAEWFYEHRGETNRAWKNRRREAAKEKRQSENRKRRGV